MSGKPVVFGALDREAEIQVSERNLPHWFQPGAAIFVTFRTSDSLPAEVIRRWQDELEEWLRNNQLPLSIARHVTNKKTELAAKAYDAMPTDKQAVFRKLSDRIWHRSLDDCLGACLLRQPELAKIVAETMLRFDGDRYDLDCFVVMPNHVHAIVQFRTGFDLSLIGQSWMRYSGRVINQRVGRSGPFWQPEPFDHILRSVKQFEYLQRYVAENPKKAKLQDGEFLVWKR